MKYFGCGLAEMNVSVAEVSVSLVDIPGAILCEAYKKHTVCALHWWLSCRGIGALTFWKRATAYRQARHLDLLAYSN